MQGMKAYAAALGIVDWVRQQMVSIDQQARQHQHVVPQPGLAVDGGGEGQGRNKMENDVENDCDPVS